MRIPCPYCNSVNTRQHSDNQIYEEHSQAQASYRCDRCKKYFYRTWDLSQPRYMFHRLVIWNPEFRYDQPNTNQPRYILNPKRNDPADNDTGRY